MFKSIKYIGSLGYNETTKLHSYEYEITDSNFVIVRVAVAGAFGTEADTSAAAAIISEYSKRNLNVSANLLKLFLFYEKRYGTEYYSIKEQIEWCEQYQPLFTKELKNEIEKYLVLL